MSIFNWFFKTKQATNETQEVYTDIFTETKEDYEYHLSIANKNAKDRVDYKNGLKEIEALLHTEDFNGYYMTPHKENAEYDIMYDFTSLSEIKVFMDVFGKDFDFSYKINLGRNIYISIYATKK